MIAISPLQLDALTEVFNVGAGRAAASLSEIVGEEVKLSVPFVKLYQSADVSTKTLSLKRQRLGAVSQVFTGAFDAEAMLLFTEESALEIVREMMGSQLGIEELAEFEQEAMCELGNIILNACLSAMADILGVVLEGSLPKYKVDSSENIVLERISGTYQPVMLALHIDLLIEKKNLEGNLVFLLSTPSLEELLTHIDRFVAGI